MVETFRDITQELAGRLETRTKAIKNDLARLVQEDKLISLGKLVASVAHEINNPIGSILNFTMLIHKNISDHPPSEAELKDYQKWLDLTVQEARRCAKIVSNLLSFSRQQTLETKRLDLRELLEQVLLLTGHRLELSNIRQDTAGVNDIPLEVWGDHTQIQQCFLNLVFNALEAMPKGGVLTVRGGRDPVKNEIWVAVTDTGEGILPEHSRIFLNLSSPPSRSLTEWAWACPWSMVLSPSTTDRLKWRALPGRGRPQDYFTGLILPGKTERGPLINRDICIMVVDDENAMRESLAGWLSKEGYRTLTAGSGPAALALQAEKACDLLLVDIKMQGMDGLELLQRLKAEHARGAGGHDYRLRFHRKRGRGHEAGGQRLFVKTLRPGTLLLIIDKLLKQRALAEENIILKERLAEQGEGAFLKIW